MVIILFTLVGYTCVIVTYVVNACNSWSVNLVLYNFKSLILKEPNSSVSLYIILSADVIAPIFVFPEAKDVPLAYILKPLELNDNANFPTESIDEVEL